MRTIVVGTRKSTLALTQTNQVIGHLRQIAEQQGIECEFQIEEIVTKGDRILDVTLSKVGGKGLFVKEIEQALLDKEVDMAVHSMKDVPSVRQEGLVIGAIPKRVDPRDSLISRENVKLDKLPQGARVGTSSLRRASQLKEYRPDLHVESIRGNIDSRIRKLETEGFDAILLAAAGLERMGWSDRVTEFLSPEMCLPAVGQGALAIECREDDEFVRALLGRYDDRITSLTVQAERAFLRRLNGGCQVPIGAHAIIEHAGDLQSEFPEIRLTGMVGTPDGSRILKETMFGTHPEKLGLELAETMIAAGADRILAEVSADTAE